MFGVRVNCWFVLFVLYVVILILAIIGCVCAVVCVCCLFSFAWVCVIVFAFFLCGLLLFVVCVLFVCCHVLPLACAPPFLCCSRVAVRCDIVFPRVVFLRCYILCVRFQFVWLTCLS